MDRLRLWWLAMAAQLFLPNIFSHQPGGFIIFSMARRQHQQHGAHQMNLVLENGKYVMKNGIVEVALSIPWGMVTRISYNGVYNLLEENNKEEDRGYWDIAPTEDRLFGASYKVVVQNENQIEISFIREYKTSSSVPLNIDKRYVLLRGSPGFYTYTVFERLEGFPPMQIGEARVVFKLRENMTYFMAMSDVRQRIMPTTLDRARGTVLDFKEAVQVVNPSNPNFNGEVDDKYFYSCDDKDNQVYGWVSLSENPIGFWMITPSNEFRTGGPFKQDLTSHVGPTILNMFASDHYAGKDLTIDFSNGEPWKKVLGPVFVYLNSNPQAKSNPSILWEDAKRNMLQEVAKWPYDFPNSPDFVKSNGRGGVRGRLLVLDRYVRPYFDPASFAYVGLAPPGATGSWQRENKGYQFWVNADSRGNFIIKNVIAGTYNLYASVPGRIGDYKYESNVVITPGSVENIGNLVYKPPRNGPTLWEIGIPDRTAAEYFIPKPEPTFKVHIYKEGQDRFREYGLWRLYTDLYPNNDLVYTIGVSNYTRDWFFAQVDRLTKKQGYVPTTWQIVFDLPTLKNGDYTLQLALASASYAELQVRFNNQHGDPHFTTRLIGNDNAVARHGIHGLYWMYSIEIASSLLIKGRNTIFMTQARGAYPFRDIMYDYIRLEAPK